MFAHVASNTCRGAVCSNDSKAPPGLDVPAMVQCAQPVSRDIVRIPAEVQCFGPIASTHLPRSSVLDCCI